MMNLISRIEDVIKLILQISTIQNQLKLILVNFNQLINVI